MYSFPNPTVVSQQGRCVNVGCEKCTPNSSARAFNLLKFVFSPKEEEGCSDTPILLFSFCNRVVAITGTVCLHLVLILALITRSRKRAMLLGNARNPHHAGAAYKIRAKPFLQILIQIWQLCCQ